MDRKAPDVKAALNLRKNSGEASIYESTIPLLILAHFVEVNHSSDSPSIKGRALDVEEQRFLARARQSFQKCGRQEAFHGSGTYGQHEPLWLLKSLRNKG